MGFFLDFTFITTECGGQMQAAALHPEAGLVVEAQHLGRSYRSGRGGCQPPICGKIECTRHRVKEVRACHEILSSAEPLAAQY